MAQPTQKLKVIGRIGDVYIHQKEGGIKYYSIGSPNARKISRDTVEGRILAELLDNTDKLFDYQRLCEIGRTKAISASYGLFNLRLINSRSRYFRLAEQGKGKSLVLRLEFASPPQEYIADLERTDEALG